jgi:hypothetical protein
MRHGKKVLQTPRNIHRILRARDAILFYAFYRFIYILFSFNMIFQFNKESLWGTFLRKEASINKVDNS